MFCLKYMHADNLASVLFCVIRNGDYYWKIGQKQSLIRFCI